MIAWHRDRLGQVTNDRIDSHLRGLAPPGADKVVEVGGSEICGSSDWKMVRNISCTLWSCQQFANLNMAIDIVTFPINNGDFP